MGLVARSAHARVRWRPERGGDGFLLSQEWLRGVGGRWSGASHASQGWIPAPRFHEDKLRRKDGGTTSCPRKRVPRGGGGVSGPLTRPRDGFLLSQERRWNHVVPAQAGTQRGEVERRGLSRGPGMDSCFRRKDGGTTSCPRKRVPRGGRWSVRASHAFQGWIPAFAGMVAGSRCHARHA